MKTKYWRLKHAQQRQMWPNANHHQLERWYLLESFILKRLFWSKLWNQEEGSSDDGYCQWKTHNRLANKGP